MERVFMKTSSLHLQKPVRNKLFQFILRFVFLLRLISRAPLIHELLI